MDIKTKSYLIIGVWSLYVIYLYTYRTTLIDIITTSSFLVGSFIYLLTNPAYLLLIYYVIKTSTRSKIKASIASVIMVFALDIVSFPRILMNEIFSTSSSVVSNMGGIAIKSMVNFGISQTIAYFSYYLIFPLLLMWFALELSGHVDFVRRMKRGGV